MSTADTDTEQKPVHKRELKTHVFVYWLTTEKKYWVDSVVCPEEEARVQTTCKAIKNLGITIRDLVVWATGSGSIPVMVLRLKDCDVPHRFRLGAATAELLVKIIETAAEYATKEHYRDLVDCCFSLIRGKKQVSTEWAFKDRIFKTSLTHHTEDIRVFLVKMLIDGDYKLIGVLHLDNDGFVRSNYDLDEVKDWSSVAGRAQQEINDSWNKLVEEPESEPDPTSN